MWESLVDAVTEADEQISQEQESKETPDSPTSFKFKTPEVKALRPKIFAKDLKTQETTFGKNRGGSK